MRLSRQHKFGECGLHCLAMLTDTPVKELRPIVRWTVKDSVRFISEREMIRTLAELGYSTGWGLVNLPCISSEVTVTLYLSSNALVTVDSKRRGWFHYVVWNVSEQLIYDPTKTEPVTPNNYTLFHEYLPVTKHE